MVSKVDVEAFLKQRSSKAVLDVRTPAEFAEGHVPGALNLPLFSNEERATVGTLYKQKGPDHALMEGLSIVGPKMKTIAEDATRLAAGKDIILHCWRGGKRSESVGWLLDFAGMDVGVLDGGYKNYRNYTAEMIRRMDPELIVLGGRTGSRKTAVLNTLASLGEQIIDLEGMANHKGSAFGWIGEAPQPSTQQFENELFDVVSSLDLSKPIWVENESKSIGRVYIPDAFWDKMKSSTLIHLDVPLDVRVNHLVALYSDGDNINQLRASFNKIRKRLGGQHLNTAIDALEKDDLREAARIALVYYDKAYDYNLSVNDAPSIHVVDGADMTVEDTARNLIDFYNNIDKSP